MHGRCSFFSQQTVYEIFNKLDALSAADPLSVTIAELSARNVTTMVLALVVDSSSYFDVDTPSYSLVL